MAETQAQTQAPAATIVPDQSLLDKSIEATLKKQSVTWKAADTGETLDLSISHVRKLFANPTKSGKMPTDRDCWLFLQLCKARGLNPYVGDAFLVGYDEQSGAKFSLITAHQALLKRAEASGKKKGMESGVIVRTKAGDLVETPGDFTDDSDTLLGGWCKVYRTDYEKPIYERVKLATYNKGFGRWRIDPAGMITKCAESSAHRIAFPAETAGMYIREELDAMRDDDHHERSNGASNSKTTTVEELSAPEPSQESDDGTSGDTPSEPSAASTSHENAQSSQSSDESQDPNDYEKFMGRGKAGNPTAPKTEAAQSPEKPKAARTPSSASDSRGSATPEWKSCGMGATWLRFGGPALEAVAEKYILREVKHMTGDEVVMFAKKIAELEASGELKPVKPAVAST